MTPCRHCLSLLIAAAVNIFICSAQSDESQSVADTGSISAGQFQLRYRIEGTGIPALVIGNSLYYPRVFSQQLRTELRLVFLDHRGFARPAGQVDTTHFALDTLIEDMERARSTLKISRMAVIGHSGHAIMALEYAKKYPQHVSHVIMIGIGPDMSAASSAATAKYWRDSASAERKSILEENRRRIPDSLIARRSPSDQFILRYVRNGPRSWYDARFDSSPLWKGSNVNTDVMSYVWGQVLPRIDFTKGLDDFDIPVFLALGRYDYLVPPPSAWDTVRSKFRNLTVRIFEQSGHTPPYEEASLFDKELLAWLERHR